jgi:hypothetical protein
MKVRIETPRASGAVESVDGSSTSGSCGTSGASGSFTLEGRKHLDPTWTVEVSSGTSFNERGVNSASFANVCVDDEATAPGRRSELD